MPEVKLHAKTLFNQELFSTGKWNGDKYTEGDLDAMVSAFHSLPIKVPVKLGHTEAQKWFGQEDGAPALGWVENVKRIGKKLVGDLVGVPDAIAQLIANRNYRTKSAEIFWNLVDPEGQKWPRALKAVSLLGADLPAVTNLNDLATVLMSNSTYTATAYEWTTTTDGSTSITYDPEWKVYQWDNMEEEDMNKEQEKVYTDKIEFLEGKITTLEAQKKDADTRATESEARAVKVEAELRNRDEKHAVEQFDVKVEGFIKDGKVLPAEKEGLIRMFVALGEGKKTYGDKEFDPRVELVKSLEERKKKVDFDHRAGGGEDGTTHPAIEVDKRARKFARDLNIDYAVAVQKVRDEDPELWKDYMKDERGGK